MEGTLSGTPTEAGRYSVTFRGSYQGAVNSSSVYTNKTITIVIEDLELPVITTNTLPDGTTFLTRYDPYALGKLDADGKYSPDCMWFDVNFLESENSLIATWTHTIGSNVPLSASFLGGKSDAYSFLEFDAQIAAGSAPGTYHMDFKGLDDPDAAPNTGETFVSSDNTPAGAKSSTYVPATPALYGLTVIVAEEEYAYIGDVMVSSDGSGLRGDVNRDGEVNAADASLVLQFAAADGLSGKASFSDQETENAVRRALADVNEADGINAADASSILIYTANAGLTGGADWSSILK